MTSITNENTASRSHQFSCFHSQESLASSGRLEHFPDVKIFKRPNDLPSNFIGGLGHLGRSERLSGVSYWTGKCMCFSPYVDRIGKHVRNVPNVRECFKPHFSITPKSKGNLGMNHAFESRPTVYNGIQFRSRLEAQWACFFDQAKWNWDYQPIDLVVWTPTFRVEFPCGHAECTDTHVLLIDVQPFDDIAAFVGHRCLDFAYGEYRKPTGESESIPADASAAFGINPDVTYWEMAHGAGGGVETIRNWVPTNAHELWKAAGNIIRGCS